MENFHLTVWSKMAKNTTADRPRENETPKTQQSQMVGYNSMNSEYFRDKGDAVVAQVGLETVV